MLPGCLKAVFSLKYGVCDKLLSCAELQHEAPIVVAIATPCFPRTHLLSSKSEPILVFRSPKIKITSSPGVIWKYLRRSEWNLSFQLALLRTLGFTQRRVRNIVDHAEGGPWRKCGQCTHMACFQTMYFLTMNQTKIASLSLVSRTGRASI